MANCNCNDFPISCAPHAPGGDCHHHHGCPPHPCPPPDYKGGTSMYIGARYVPIFADPVEWDNEREYEPLTIVVYNGDMYTSKCYVPKGAALPEYPDNQTKYWVRTADYNYQFADLKKTVNDLSRLVEQFQKDNETFTSLINGWNEQVKQWEAKMDEWQTTVDGVTAAVADLTAKLDEEIARAKDAEAANAKAIEDEQQRATGEETAIRAEFAAADTAEKDAREAADTALGERIDAEAEAREAGDAAVKALVEQEQARAEGEESAIRREFAAADTALSNRITTNKQDIDAIKAEQVTQNTNISANAKNIADNAAEIAKHADRLSALESNASDWDSVFPDTTIAQEVQKEELARANADTAINGRIDAQASDIEELRDAVNHKVDSTTYTADQSKQDTAIKANADAIAAMDTAYKAADTALGERIDAEKNRATDRENEIEAGYKEAIEQVKASVAGDYVTKTTYEAGQAAQDTNIAAAKAAADDAASAAAANAETIGSWDADHPGQTISECATSIETELSATDAKTDANTAAIGSWATDHPGKTVSEVSSDLAKDIAAVSGDIPDTSGLLSKTEAAATYQPKGDYVTYYYKEVGDSAGNAMRIPGALKVASADLTDDMFETGSFLFSTDFAGTSYAAADITELFKSTVWDDATANFASESTVADLESRVDGAELAANNAASLATDAKSTAQDAQNDIGAWSKSYPDTTITSEITALKNSTGGTTYSTIAEAIANEHPIFLPLDVKWKYNNSVPTFSSDSSFIWGVPSNITIAQSKIDTLNASLDVTTSYANLSGPYGSESLFGQANISVSLENGWLIVTIPANTVLSSGTGSNNYLQHLRVFPST